MATAVSGTTVPIDRDFVAEALGFDQLMANSLDSSSDRDFVIGADVTEIDDPGRAKDPIEGDVNGRFAIFHRVLAEINV